MSRLNFFQNKPKAEKLDIDAYLKRIHEQKENPSFAYLKRLHRSHLLHVPFENLDIHYNKKIQLDYQSVFEKVIKRKRGGYCYELNGLFYHLLFHLGFEVKLISARVKKEKLDEYGKEYDHMAIIVRLPNEDFLVDVGFGKGMVYPKKIEVEAIQMDYLDYWKISKDIDDNYFLKVSSNANSFATKYTFSVEEKQVIQFHEMNEYHQTNPDSSFVQRKLITQLTKTGRITLNNTKFTEEKLGQRNETPIESEDEFLSVLDQHFSIKTADI